MTNNFLQEAINQLQDLSAQISAQQRIREISQDNVFNADHRRRMIQEYGATEAQWLTIEELMLTL